MERGADGHRHFARGLEGGEACALHAASLEGEVMIDWKKLKTAIAENTRRIRALKREGRRWEAMRLKLDATRLHAIAAHARGHIHLSGPFLCNPYKMGLSKTYEPCFRKMGMSLEEQALFISGELSSFTQTEQQEAASVGG